jgi:multisubunit Na+/H+ antiporter MnhC subunit
MERASVIKQKPPPDVPTAAFAPAYAIPSAMVMTAISLSG